MLLSCKETLLNNEWPILHYMLSALFSMKFIIIRTLVTNIYKTYVHINWYITCLNLFLANFKYYFYEPTDDLFFKQRNTVYLTYQ